MQALAPLLGLVVLAAPLAGCLGDDAPPPTPPGPPGPAAAPIDASLAPGRLVCHGDVCNHEATVDPDARQANELSIAVNPTDPQNIIATGKDYTPDEAGECVWSGLYTTLDGGATWTNQNVPGSPWKKRVDPMAPVNEFSKFWCATDPVVAFGPDGTAYWTVMPYQCDPLSGSKTGRGVLPQGGLNDWFWTCSSMYVLVSEDKGLTWSRWAEVAFGPRLEHDKQWISVAPDGTVLLCWDRSNPAQAGQPTDPAAEQLAGASTMTCSVSKDQGRSWSEPAPLNTDWAGFLPWVDWGPDGRAYVAAVNGTHVVVASSDDGLGWGQPVAVGTYEDPPPGGEYGWPVLQGSDFRTFAVPSLAVDRSDGPDSGSVYVTWFDHASGDGDVMLSASRDGGMTWSTPVRVHDDDAALARDQFMPALAVGPDGTVDVSWYDRRDDPDNHLFHRYYTYSVDGGRTFAPNLRLTDVASDEQYSHHQNGMVFLGDYVDVDAAAGRAYVVWTDTRNEKADVFVAIVERPAASG